ncbi:hypothetical protein CP985_10245 [Malaciobacter mytili LMG 24559]|uniref:GGDEF domain-containing protein n=1 Tax=Malaciobacter mytili LMG 24559 TaxID=1032238 RepID=A0AAX2ADP7_9BACT|nr:diguanylate cyclase [Malaciobacter mytili]AXH14663.1 hypothetical protein AMYT_1075 [Malaciobacter mytili LMG 24559]RXK15122.1 hypothetical protein CP985_10245 [Malaciobacter mytili LMG 24559]
MKEILKKITDDTINELLLNDIILPSSYFQCFDKHAKTLDINLEDKEFDNKLNNLIAQEFKDINEYASKALKSLEQVTNATKDAKEAIKNKDESSLKRIYQEMEDLKKELNSVSNKVLKDTVTKTFNKKWIYNIFLKNNEEFKNNGVLVLIEIDNCDYILENYGQLIYDNLQIFITKFVSKKIKEEKLHYDVAKFNKKQFLIFLENEELKESTNVMKNIKDLLHDTTLKSKSGILIKPNFSYTITTYNKKEKFSEVIESLKKF